MNRLKNNSASTLIEIVIVLAIVGVMSVMVASFTIMCSAWVSIGTARLNVVKDSSLLSDTVHKFLSSYDTNDCIFTLKNDKTITITKQSDNTEVASICFIEGYKTIVIDGNISDTAQFSDTVSSITFDVIEGDPGREDAVLAKITFDLPTGKKTEKIKQGSREIVVGLRAAQGFSY